MACDEGLSFWGGVNAETGVIQDAHHPQHGQALAGKVVLMPTSRGSCSGSGVLLQLALNGHAPAALIFHEAEDILTLGAFIASKMYRRNVAVIRLSKHSYDLIASGSNADISSDAIITPNAQIPLQPLNTQDVSLSKSDEALLQGEEGPASQLAMEAIRMMAAVQGATALTDVTRGHIDGCIYGGNANLIFAETIEKMGARIKIPTTMNAISVDLENWQDQNVPSVFGSPAARLAQAYVAMGAKPTFTCAPYLDDDRPQQGEDIGWSESNAVIYANSVLGARTVKHPDYFDLFVAMTGRAPLSDVYLAENRQPQRCISVELPSRYDDAIWPLIGWIVGQLSPDRVPLIQGLQDATPNDDDQKGLCAAFGTTSAAPLLHIQGVTPEGNLAPSPDADRVVLTHDMMRDAWRQLNAGPEQVDLVALGSPHFSLSETRAFANLINGQSCAAMTTTIITLGRSTFAQAREQGVVRALEKAGVRVLQDLCWCSITEPLFPPHAKHLVTNSGKYAHYAPGLSGRTVRFAGLAQCAKAALTGRLPADLPDWLR